MSFQLSYWEQETYFSKVDFTIIGGGIVGLHCALSLRKKYPKNKIVVLERGLLPRGASTKNAGFACFGSISELLDDLNTQTEEAMVSLVEKRYLGLQKLKKGLGSKGIGYRHHRGFELFQEGNPELYEACLENRNRINNLLFPLFKKEVFSVEKNSFGFAGIQDYYMANAFEGQIDTGKMMYALYSKCIKEKIKILYGTEMLGYDDAGSHVEVQTDLTNFYTQKLCLATNGFLSLKEFEDIQPARAQVLITKPIKNLHIKGSFHLDKGYYYFRNIHNRILLGGGRNLDFKKEATAEFGTTETIQNKLKEILKTVILPNTVSEIDYSWSGIMGVGSIKKPIIEALSNNIFCGVRLGGMGIAIGAQVGEELAKITIEHV
ncbi:NAD(P)/FAD-dependent oxidoreductase [Galbibacter pacificus]|uniref:FAD-dependent oxidoreductase n=1 Tax=Galbibacter pacificus TaxID=2996052 RepID=A0ABT6FS27_9FLAO|nr:FAD-dependent oxidoreductase [Galbibacter pacificus]MDG3582811.1 FAD-dependent oxidoreductase [Galbibacter pacificus]MDG3586070.1 FAD-dependent oxidoreductase [Galbibacter pacificus]